ncbi:MAG TPA: hypothetical protein VFW52_03170 [Candidatus Saccharimonadales bacterium]|nr:hypothetical protein [Candidatus Saccharimonadales bacterium]
MLQLGIDSLRAKDGFYLTRTTSIGFTLLSPVMAFCGLWFMAAAVI